MFAFNGADLPLVCAVYADLVFEYSWRSYLLHAPRGSLSRIMAQAFFVNFFAPFLILMTRDAKRKNICWCLYRLLFFIGHWRFYLMIIPGSMVTLPGHHAEPMQKQLTQHMKPQLHNAWCRWSGNIGWMEVGTTIGFIGLFAYITQHFLSKAPLVVKNHPMMEESLHHSI